MKSPRRQRGNPGSWSPKAEFDRLRGEISRFLDTRAWPAGSPYGKDWIPSVDVFQDAERITVQAELPGFNKEEINVSIQGDSLTLSGERKHEQEIPGDEAYQSERFYGRFRREITLPQEVDPEKASATYKDGVLCVYLPKTEQSKAKQIQVQAS